MGSSFLAPPPEAGLPEEPLFKYGPVNFRPHLRYRFLYGDGVAAAPGQHLTTAINEVYPGMLLELGQHWRLDYTPSLHYYSNDHFRDTLNHSAALDGGTTNRNWILSLSQHYDSASYPLIETGGQTDQEFYMTAVNGICQLNNKSSLELGFNQYFRFLGGNPYAETLLNAKQWSTLDWYNYQLWPRFGVGGGVGGGYADLNLGSSASFEQLQARVSWQVGDKLALQASGGFEDRQFLNVNEPDLIAPIFTAALLYQPSEVTTVSLNANRSVMNSYILNYGMVYEDTDIYARLQQRLLQKLQFGLLGGYRIYSYEATIPGYALTREDHYTYVTVRLSVPFLKRGTAGIFYQANRLSSTVYKFALSSNQVGFDLMYRF